MDISQNVNLPQFSINVSEILSDLHGAFKWIVFCIKPMDVGNELYAPFALLV